MKWLIVEDALRDRRGHWLEYVSTFVRGLTALGDEVEVLCDCRAEGFVMEQTGARPVLPESIWHRMGDGAGAVKRYLRVPGHALATFVVMRKFFRSFYHRGHREHRVGVDMKWEAQGNAQGTCAGAEFSKPSTSELARDSETTSLSRCASGPAEVAEPLRTDESKHVPCSATETEPKEPATRHQLPATSSPPDWIFVPTALVHHLLGWWLLIKSGAVPKGARVLLFFPNLPIRLDDQGQPHWTGGPTTKLMAWLFENLRGEVESGKVVLGVETHAMRRALASLIGMKVVYLPHPVEFHTETRRRGGVESSEFLTTEDTECIEDKFVQKQGAAWSSQASAEFSNPSTSELAHDCENTSLNRSTIGSASALDSRRLTLDSKTSAKPIVFGCYGAARWEKGSDIFQEAIKLILKNEVASGKWRVASLEDEPQLVTRDPLPVTAAERPFRFAIQWVEDFQNDSGNLVSIDPWLREHPQVEVIGRYFQGDEYERRLAETDVMVLPYRSPYRLRVSRVVIEAMMHGMPVIATEGTTLHEQSNAHGCGLGCQEEAVEGLAETILEAVENFDQFQRSARAKIRDAERSFSVNHFRQLLINLKIN
jgi:glycosyltransferase involved in cell wall biosynthesis